MRLASSTLAGVLLSLGSLAACSSNKASHLIHSPVESFELHGHRGARAREPENSLFAFRHAIHNGANVLEADMAVTKDNVVVLNHEVYVDPKRCQHPSKKLSEEKPTLIRSLNFSELLEYECGAKGNPKFPLQARRVGIRIATLRELLALSYALYSMGHPVKLNIETKIAKDETDEEIENFVRQVLLTLSQSEFPSSRVILQSFDWRSIKLAKTLNPELQSSALIAIPFQVGEVMQDFQEAQMPEYLSPHYRLTNKEVVEQAHKEGFKIVPWTANSQQEWSRLLEIGVDGIITDDPMKLYQYLAATRGQNERRHPQPWGAIR